MALAQRDRWSIGSKVYLCSKHFTDDCFESSEEGLVLKPHAVPTIAAALPLKEVLISLLIKKKNHGVNYHRGNLTTNSLKEPLFRESETDDHSMEYGSLEELISASNDTFKLEEHQYALPPPGADGSDTFVKEPLFARYDAMELYLKTGRYFKISKAIKGSIRRQSKGFNLTGKQRGCSNSIEIKFKTLEKWH